MTLTEFDSWYRLRFRRTSSWVIVTAMIIADFIGVMVSFGAGFFVVKMCAWDATNFKSFVTYWPHLPVFILIFQIMHLYPGVALAPAEELRAVTIGSLMAHGSIILTRYIENPAWSTVSMSFTLSFLFSIIIIIISRELVHVILHKIRLGAIPAVVYGAGTTGRLLVDQLLKSARAGYTPALILDDNPERGDDYRGIPIVHNTALGPEIVKTYRIKMAIIAMPNITQAQMSRIMNFSASAFKYTVVIPAFFGLNNIWMSVRDFGGILGFATSHRLKIGWNLAIKRFLDIAIVTVGGLVLLPFLLVVALLVKLTSSGPVLYSHTRLGQGGKPFKAYKFRSMVADADKQLENLLASDPKLGEEWESSHKLKNDPRVTAIGRFLRRTSFDEFPQLLNILKGEMSLVGPRPVVEAEMEKYGENFQRIFAVKPGLTGLWQISGRSDTDYRERVSFDTYYLQSWSVWLDLWILYHTPGQIIRGRGAY